MIKYLTHNTIDKNRWDDCICKSLNRRVYAFSWYLDAVCPGWDALVEDDYTSVFPLTHNRKWGISYLFQPFFAQQLGLFSQYPVTAERLNLFIRAIPGSFKFVEIQLNAMNNFEVTGGKTKQRVNHELDISAGFEELAAKFAQNTKRNIRKSEEMNVRPGSNIGVDELIELFSENFGKKEGKLQPRHYKALRNLIVYCQNHGLGHIRSIVDKNGSLSAAAFFLFDEMHVYFLFAASSEQARENGAMFALISQFLAENAGKYSILDFEGGNDPNLGRFYKSFGAAEVGYPALYMNRLPKVMTRLLYFAGKRG
jgi:hypothetical protein